MSDSDADEYVYLGTPLQGSDKVALPVNQQTVRDAAGRQRLHGAFTGGYSAGFFNTTGSQAGFNPATFTSSRGKRANLQQQNVADFLDEDELEELGEKGLQAKAEYDTFQTDSTAKSHTQAADQAAARHGLNLFPEEALKPVVNSIGVQLLQKMGWKQGRGLGFQESNNLQQMGYDLSAATAQSEPVKRTKKRRWGPMTGLQIQNAQFIRLKQKANTYGLGYDPYAQSEELRTAKKRMREEAGLAQRHAVDSKGRRARGTAFAASVLEENEFYGGDFEDYADDVDPHAGMHFEVVSSEDDADDVPGARRRSPLRVECSAPTVLLKARQGTMGRDSFIEGYVRGSMHQPAVVESTRLPGRIRTTRHRFEQPCSKLYGALRQQSAAPVAVASVPPPDKYLKQRIDLAAATLARGGSEMTEFLRRTHAGVEFAGNEGYAFLDGGEGSAYFHYRTQQIRDALTRATTAVLRVTVPQLQQGAASTAQAHAPSQHEDQYKLTVEQRRNMLAEPTLAGTSEPAKHQQDMQQQQQSAPGSTADARAELLAQAEMAGVVRKGAALASRFVKAGQGPSERESDVTTSSGPSARMLPPTRTKSEWIPSPLVCRCWNVPRPKPSEITQQGGATGRELLSVPAAQRGDVYADALPDFMKPRAHGDSGGAVTQQQLPPPPPRVPGSHASATDGTAGAATTVKDDLDQAADDLLASIQADMAEEVEQAAPEPEELPFEKPLDVFNAIFNETDSEDDNDSEEGGDEEQPAVDPGKKETQNVEPKSDAGAADTQHASRLGAEGAGTSHRDAAAQLQEAQKATVKSMMAALDRGDPTMPSTSNGNGTQWRQEPTEEAAYAFPTKHSDDEEERHGRRDRKRSKRDKSKDKDSDRRKKRHKYEDRQERRDRSDRDLLHNATALLSGEVLAQNVSTAEIMAVAAQLKKQTKKDKDKGKKRKHHSSKHHSSSKHHTSKRERSP